MMMILHAQPGAARMILSRDLSDGDGLLILAGSAQDFDDGDLPVRVGAVGGRVLRLEYLHAQPGAFGVLADCARMFPAILAHRLRGLAYRRVVDAADRIGDAPVMWSTDAAGEVTAFDLAPMVASSPLLAGLTRDLSARAMDDDRRFRFLAAAFAGV